MVQTMTAFITSLRRALGLCKGKRIDESDVDEADNVCDVCGQENFGLRFKVRLSI